MVVASFIQYIPYCPSLITKYANMQIWVFKLFNARSNSLPSNGHVIEYSRFCLTLVSSHKNRRRSCIQHTTLLLPYPTSMIFCESGPSFLDLPMMLTKLGVISELGFYQRPFQSQSTQSHDSRNILFFVFIPPVIFYPESYGLKQI